MFLTTCGKLGKRLLARSRVPAQNRSFRPRVEGLEHRNLLAASMVSGGVLNIEGHSTAYDGVHVYATGHSTPQPYDDQIHVVTLDLDGSVVDTDTHAEWQFNPWTVTWQRRVNEVVFRGYDGGSDFENDTDLKTTAYGGLDADVFHGGSGIDIFYGHGGNDWLHGNGGNDQLYGGSGTDVLDGGNGQDYLNGGMDGAADLLEGGTGNDTFVAEWHYIGEGPLKLRVNRDQPSDFSSGDQIVTA